MLYTFWIMSCSHTHIHTHTHMAISRYSGAKCRAVRRAMGIYLAYSVYLIFEEVIAYFLFTSSFELASNIKKMSVVTFHSKCGTKFSIPE